MGYRLNPATPADQPWLEALRRAVYQDLFLATWGHWDEARHLRHCAECWERGNISIVELNCERVGMIQLHEYADRLELGEIQIQPSHQGCGIGSRLLRDVQARAHAQRKKLSLSTGIKNLRAVRLYERLGFHHVSQSETHFHMESEPAAQGSRS
jgi:ribosomal protein S18 acetylase RimI-like enzyme